MQNIQLQFPILSRQINGNRLAYLDNAATTQKPQQVIDTLTNYYSNHNANVHRGIHTLSQEATELYESTRTTTASFLGCQPEEIIFTRGTTESVNIIANSQKLTPEDEIIVSALEHHSNLVPWQELSKRTGATLKIIPLKDLELDLEAYESLLSPHTKIVAVTAMSNVTGTVTPIKEIIDLAHKNQTPQGPTQVFVDAAQLAAHFPLKNLNADFLAFSSHKMYGPTGVGVLYINQKLANQTQPLLFGGDMIRAVSQFTSEFAESPSKFEAGTPNIADVVAFKQAILFVQEHQEEIVKNDQALLQLAIEKFSKHPKVTLLTPKNHAGVLSFTIGKPNTSSFIHPHDIASIFDSEGVAIRSGHHCAEPLMNTLNLPATARLSFAIYNTEQDIEQTEKALTETMKIFS